MAELTEQVKDFLGTIRPMLQADGGDVELVNVEQDGTVKLRLKGACGGCPMSRITLKRGIEARMKVAIPAVKTVEAV